MREIKFRAKRVDNNEWIVGSIITDAHIEDEHSKVYDARIVPWPQPAMPYQWYKVNVETVGEYTGLKDKNGKDIYEGDIVQAVYEWETYDGDAYCEHSAIDKGEVVLSGGKWRVKKKISGLFEWDRNTLEIIGNIYDNPDLLK